MPKDVDLSDLIVGDNASPSPANAGPKGVDLSDLVTSAPSAPAPQPKHYPLGKIDKMANKVFPSPADIWETLKRRGAESEAAFKEDFTTPVTKPGTKGSFMDVPLRAGKVGLDVLGYGGQAAAGLGEEFGGRAYQTAGEAATGQELPKAKSAFGDAASIFMKGPKITALPSEVQKAYEAAQMNKGLANTVKAGAKNAQEYFRTLFHPGEEASPEMARAAHQKAVETAKKLMGPKFDPTKKTFAEAIGQEGADRLATTARHTGAASEAVPEAVAARQAARETEFNDLFAKQTGFHPKDAQRDIESFVDQMQEEVRPKYQEVFAKAGPVMTASMDKLVQDNPEIKAALREAIKAHGPGATAKVPIKKMVPSAVGGLREEVRYVDAPTAEVWHNAKRILQSMVHRDETTNKIIRSGDKGLENLGRERVASALTQALKKNIPGYEKLTNEAGEYTTARAAAEKFKGKFFSAKTNTNDFKTMFDSLRTEGEKSAARHQIAADLFDTSQGKQDIITKLVKPNGAPIASVKAKLETAFGKKRADAIFDNARRMREEMSFEHHISPRANSITSTVANKTAEMAKESGAALFSPGGMAGAGAAGGFLTGGSLQDRLKRGAEGAAMGWMANKGVKAGEKVGLPFRDKLSEILLMSPEEAQKVINADLESAAKEFKPTPWKPSNPALRAAGLAGVLARNKSSLDQALDQTQQQK